MILVTTIALVVVAVLAAREAQEVREDQGWAQELREYRQAGLTED